MEDWNLPWDGGCRCSETRIRVTSPPLIAMACHCTGCQRMSASAFSLNLAIPADGFAVTAGEPVLGGLQKEDRHYFCPACKSWMFTRPCGLDWLVNLRPTMLDEHDWFVPFVEVWTREKLPWATTPARHSFETAPELEDYRPLIEAFVSEGARP